MKKGIFVTFEGIEGSGKTTQIKRFCEYLDGRGVKYIRTVEPGGTLISDEIRKILRKILLSVEHSGMTSLTELLLYAASRAAASRAQHVDELIRPSLEKGLVVVCDRFGDSTMAYQGYGRGLDRGLINNLNVICTGGIEPDITFLLDLDIEIGLRRNREAKKIDRLELEELSFHQKVRAGYHALAREHKERILVIDSERAPEVIAEELSNTFKDYLARKGYGI